MRKYKTKTVLTKITGESKTRQSAQDDADINRIVSRGIIPPDPSTLQYGDFTNAQDFRSIQDQIVLVKNTFDALPSHVRAFLRNDPSNMLDVVNNQKDVAVELGLLPPPVKKENPPVLDKTGEQVVPPVQSAKPDTPVVDGSTGADNGGSAATK